MNKLLNKSVELTGKIMLFVFISLLTPLSSFAQGNDQVAMADLMRSNGKIYVVVAVLVIIFIGILLFLIAIERRLRRLEKKQEKQLVYTEQP